MRPVNACANGWKAAAAIASLITGVVLAHLVEPGVKVEKVILAGDTPAIHVFPRAISAPHPVALLAHGVTGSKENLFRIGEALAAAGFDCYTVDLPGHGESRQIFSRDDIVKKFGRVTRAIGPVDVFVGHSMGASVGAASVWNGDLNPKLFIALGANPDLGEHGPPLLLMAGRFDELQRLAPLKARSDARLVVSSWSDHGLEVWDPHLVNAAVEAACGAVGKSSPPASWFWLWRFGGVVLGAVGALGLIWCLPKASPWLLGVRGVLIATVIVVTISLTTDRWVGSALNPHRIPLQLAIGFLFWVAYAGVGRLGLTRWSLAIATSILALALIIAPVGAPLARHLLAILCVIVTLFICAGMMVAGITFWRASRRDGDIAFAIFVGYAIGQWIPKFF